MVDGIAEAAAQLLHEASMSSGQIYTLGRKLRAAWTDNDGKARIDGLYSALKTRLAEHAASVRLAAVLIEELPPPLTE